MTNGSTRNRQGALALTAPVASIGEGERWAKARGFGCVVGVDEVGRGPIAGPVVAAAVHLSDELGARLVEEGLNDSKRVARGRREILARVIEAEALSSIALVDAERIDEINILAASLEAMASAVQTLREKLAKKDMAADLVLVDGNMLIGETLLPNVRQRALVKGDQRSVAIAAASVVAKVFRDALMVSYDEQYPGYGFGRHKGYPSALHKDALRRLGPSPIHRMSFRGVEPAMETAGKRTG